MSLNDCIWKTLKPWPILVDHYTSGNPYLEVHHLIRLIDDGPDTPENCVAVCPNCHRELHYGSKSKSITEGLIRNKALSNC
ncbi:HNH endonuclease [Vibrio fluvialis]|uniref:HNH endonuclease signature motif containing protein n=1 Tax=Vibrio fluvialis TaxID=676 RepID=UPI001C9CD0E9|nr:HNH endonuclease [Vibrio fluvialis]MBY8160016.1 HNH endonuclease [Vibrio fluvialis]MBY8297216.1 HNH endonuclease [Vibrio fluvialis]MBY8314104.1 HNH endonuclease [Vibrio fluvialis]